MFPSALLAQTKPPLKTPPVAAPKILAHYMAWYEARPIHAQWGWHWAMNHFEPEKRSKDGKGRREAASVYYPLIGLYDSSDPDTLQYHLLLMKIAGIDGVIFDWYGSDDYLDYGHIDQAVKKAIPFIEKARMTFALCFEPQTVEKEIAGGVFKKNEAVSHAQRLLQATSKAFFASSAYLRLANRPVFLSFGAPYYSDAEWSAIQSPLTPALLHFTEYNRQLPTASVGAYDWPQPAGGTEKALASTTEFYQRAKTWPYFIAAAYPRFDDIYAQAGIGKSYGHIDDKNGRTYVETLTRGLQSGAPVVQIASWNDWGEGTQIEPSVEFGYRDLEATQRLRRRFIGSNFAYTADDLLLPARWYALRKKYADKPDTSAKLASFFDLIVAGRTKEAKSLLNRYEK